MGRGGVEEAGGGARSSELPAGASELLAEALPDLPDAPQGSPGDPVPIFVAQAICAAVVDRRGRIICTTTAFDDSGAAAHLEPDRLSAALRHPGPIVSIVDVGAGERSEAAAFVYARAEQASAWRLPPQIAEAAAAHPDAVVVLSSQGGGRSSPLLMACQAYGLTRLQSRIVVQTIRTGAVKEAAAEEGVSFHTAREAIAAAMRRTQCRRMPQLVSKLTELSIGVFPQDPKDALVDIWGLSPRQSTIAGLIGSGMSRAEAARALHLGEATVKKELDEVYRLLQVNSATALARKVVETRALRWLTHVTRGDAGFLHSASEPLQFVHSDDGRRIAFSDYGPAEGRPVLVMHSATTTRYVPRRLLAALHAAGYRPISIDRPGFGLTDDVAAADEPDHFEVAAADAERVLDRLRIAQVDVVSRGSLHLFALHERAPHRLGRVVLVNPALPRAIDRSTAGLFGKLKSVFASHPGVISAVLRTYVQHLTLERFSRAFRRWADGSPTDMAAAQDPEIMRDYFMGARMLTTGRVSGALREVARYSAEQPRAPAPELDWTVMMAGHDMLYDVEQSTAYWRSVLPNARFEVVAEAGRLLAMTHPEAVLASLQS